jgi:hypothetical protein
MHWLEITVSVLASLALAPVAFFFECFPCCEGCGVADGKPRTDPANEGTWVPSGTWRGVGGVTWSFTANPGDDSGETWFFYGSVSTSKVGGGATSAESQDWGNICNWYSNKTTSPSTLTGLPGAFDNRATRLPPVNAVVHIYTPVSTVTAGPQTVQYAYFWTQGDIQLGSEITSTAAAHDSVGGAVFNNTADNSGTFNGGATFNVSSINRSSGTVNGGAVFNNEANNSGTVNDGATFNDDTGNFATVNGGAVFNNDTNNSGNVNGGATFNVSSINQTSGTVNGGAVFNNDTNNSGNVNSGATLNDSSKNQFNGTVNGGATFNDAACSLRRTGNFFATPCTRKFVAHPTDLPVCNGTAPDGCNNSLNTCGCG